MTQRYFHIHLYYYYFFTRIFNLFQHFFYKVVSLHINIATSQLAVASSLLYFDSLDSEASEITSEKRNKYSDSSISSYFCGSCFSLSSDPTHLNYQILTQDVHLTENGGKKRVYFLKKKINWWWLHNGRFVFFWQGCGLLTRICGTFDSLIWRLCGSFWWEAPLLCVNMQSPL